MSSIVLRKRVEYESSWPRLLQRGDREQVRGQAAAQDERARVRGRHAHHEDAHLQEAHRAQRIHGVELFFLYLGNWGKLRK